MKEKTNSRGACKHKRCTRTSVTRTYRCVTYEKFLIHFSKSLWTFVWSLSKHFQWYTSQCLFIYLHNRFEKCPLTRLRFTIWYGTPRLKYTEWEPRKRVENCRTDVYWKIPKRVVHCRASGLLSLNFKTYFLPHLSLSSTRLCIVARKKGELTKLFIHIQIYFGVFSIN